ncbi:40S ribosomal protein S25 [Candidatus Bathyarchaeota archaeon]|nr:40S ribosomal protein S25 [Candidatus Bathyarchaeota archaeon]
MPGKKSLKKMEKQQDTKDKGDKKAKEKRDKIIGAIEIPDATSDEVMGALKGMKAITPTAVAGRFNLKVSVAKRMLCDLEDNGTLHLAARSHNLKVYALRGD